jgi:type I restriction enzyme M protein
MAFSHFGAGVKSSLVFVRKKKKDEKLGNYPIFMAIAEYIGYDATGRTILQNDFKPILEEYRKFEKNKKRYKGV